MSLIRTASIKDFAMDPRSWWSEPHDRMDTERHIRKLALLQLYLAEEQKRWKS